jgi:hypothetical protein
MISRTQTSVALTTLRKLEGAPNHLFSPVLGFPGHERETATFWLIPEPFMPFLTIPPKLL